MFVRQIKMGEIRPKFKKYDVLISVTNDAEHQ